MHHSIIVVCWVFEQRKVSKSANHYNILINYWITFYHNQQIMQGEISLDKSLQIAFLDLFINKLKACVV